MNNTTLAGRSGELPMRNFLATALGMALVTFSALPADSRAEETPLAPGGGETAQVPDADRLSAPQLEQLLAPIALYPDALLSQILMASTYPLEVIEAYRWVSEAGNAQLKGQALETALDARDWDPSVKSLVQFPDILKIMNDKLGWMQQLGNAFLAQEADIMDAVQRLRAQAAAAGNLQSNEQQRVVTQQQTIVIEPVSPQVVYVPYYDPVVVYGPWPWAAYPPVYFGPTYFVGYPGYEYRSGLFTWFSFGTIGFFWGWSSCDWHHHNIYIDRYRYNRIIAYSGRPSYHRDTWEHDPYHRRGVAYTSAKLNERYRPGPSGRADSRLDYRGYQPTVHTSAPSGSSGTAGTTGSTAGSGTTGSNTPTTSKAPATTYHPTVRLEPSRGREPAVQSGGSPARTPNIETERRTRETYSAPAARTQQNRTYESRPAPATTYTPRAPQPAQYRAVQPQSNRTYQAPSAPQVQQVPPAFENYTSGAAARAEAQRARTSRESSAAPPAQAPSRQQDAPPRARQGGPRNHRQGSPGAT